jgi:hypothetical protein
MADAQGDAEIRALEAVFDALHPLDDEARNRVLEYTLKRLGMRELPSAPDSPAAALPTKAVEQTPQEGPSATTDIRSLKDKKDPSSAIDMAAVVAYYLAEAAPEDERKDTVNSADLEKYFKQAQFPLPGRMANTLPNAAKAGYFDSAARGEYRLNPVGHNLVTQNLPRGSAQGTRKSSSRKRAATPRRAKKKTAGTPSKRANTRKATAKKRTR